MKNSSYTMQIIEPEEGYWLTQKEDVELLNRAFSKKVYLGANDSSDNWVEIDDDTYNSYLEQIEAQLNAEEAVQED